MSFDRFLKENPGYQINTRKDATINGIASTAIRLYDSKKDKYAIAVYADGYDEADVLEDLKTNIIAQYENTSAGANKG